MRYGDMVCIKSLLLTRLSLFVTFIIFQKMNMLWCSLDKYGNIMWSWKFQKDMLNHCAKSMVHESSLRWYFGEKWYTDILTYDTLWSDAADLYCRKIPK